MEQIEHAQEEIKKSRRKRDRLFWLWYLFPLLFWGGERMIYVWIAIDDKVMRPPEDTLGVPFPVFTILGMGIWAVFSLIAIVAVIVIVCVIAHKQRKIEKQQAEVLLSLGEVPEKVRFRSEWLLMLLPVLGVVATVVLRIHPQEFYIGMLAECIIINFIFWILKAVQLLRQKR